MSQGEIDLESLIKRLKYFAGRTASFESARHLDDLGPLALLSQVQGHLTRPRDGNPSLAAWIAAVRMAIRESSRDFPDGAYILDGQAARIHVSADRVAKAIEITFGICHEPDTSTTQKRREAVRKVLGLERKVRSYRAGSEADLLSQLAERLVRAAQNSDQARTQGLEVSISINSAGRRKGMPPRRFDSRISIDEVKFRREVRSKMDGASRAIHREGEVNGINFAPFGYERATGRFRLETFKTSYVADSRTVIEFPAMSYGDSVAFEYVTRPNRPCIVDGPIWVQPLESYEKLVLRLLFQQEYYPEFACSFSGVRSIPRPFDCLLPFRYRECEFIEVEPDLRGECRLEIGAPKPHLYYGFIVFVRPLDVEYPAPIEMVTLDDESEGT